MIKGNVTNRRLPNGHKPIFCAEDITESTMILFVHYAEYKLRCVKDRLKRELSIKEECELIHKNIIKTKALLQDFEIMESQQHLSLEYCRTLYKEAREFWRSFG